MGRLIFLFIFILVSCAASASFPFRYYRPELEKYEGILRGDKPENDLAFKECEPSSGKATPCLVMLKDEFFRLKAEYEANQQELICWQSGKCSNH